MMFIKMNHLMKQSLTTGKTSIAAAKDLFSRAAVASFSTPASPGPQNSVPQYTIFGEKTMLSAKVMQPSFRTLKNGSLVLDNNKKGRILLEWSPRIDGGGFDRSAQIRFGLSVEELGFILHQLPDNVVEFSRRLPADTPGVAAGEVPEKILTITPNEGGQFAFKIDFVRDGVGGQKAGPGEATGPLEVVAQLGEYVVIRELFQKTIPTLIGWDVQLKYAIEQSVSMALQNGGSPPSGGRYAKPAMSSEAAADTPF